MDIDINLTACMLYKSIYNKNLTDTERLLKTGADPNKVLEDKGINALHLAVGLEPIKYSENITRLLLSHGGDPNKRSDDGMSSLHVAAAWGRLSILKMLLDSGADPFIMDYEGKTPLEYGQENQHFPIIDYLLQYIQTNHSDVMDAPDKYELKLDKIILTNGEIQGEYVIDASDDNYSTIVALSKSNIVERWFKKNDSIINDENSPAKIKKSTKKIRKSKNVLQNFSMSSSYKSCVSDRDDDLIKLDEEESPTNKLTDIENNCNLNESEKKSSTLDSFLTGIESIAFTKDPNLDMYSVKIKETHDISDIELKSSLNSRSFINHVFHDTPEKFRHENYLTKSTLHVKRTSPKDISSDGPPRYSELSNISSKQSDLSADFYGDRSTSECSHSNNLNIGVMHSKINDSNLLDCPPCDISKKSKCLEFALDTTASNNVKSKQNITRSNETLTSITEEYKYEDEQAGVVLIEKRILVTPIHVSGEVCDKSLTSAASSLLSLPVKLDYDTDSLRRELTVLGEPPGPITRSTKRVYLRKLTKLKKHPSAVIVQNPNCKTYSVELEKTFRDAEWYLDLSSYNSLERKIVEQFEEPNPNKRWREGIIKSSFTYLLLDPRITDNLPCKADLITKPELWKRFVDSIFYVGKGKRSRPYCHLYQAVSFYTVGQKKSQDKKIQNILDIWNDNLGVVCLHVFQNVIPAEAYTREAAMIDVLGLKNLKNVKPGNYYGVMSTWPLKQKKKLGVYLLYRAMLIFLNEGERQLRPADIG